MIRFLLISVGLLFGLMLQAQDNLEMTFANPEITNDGMNDFYEVDVYISSTSEFLMGIGQFYFTYNTAAFGDTPELDGNFFFEQPAGSILDEGIDATPAAKFYSGFNTAQNTIGRISVNWNHTFAASTKSTNNVTATPKLLCHLRMQYLDSSLDPMICFEQDPLFDDQNAKACGPFTSANPFESADCTNFPAVVVTDDVYVCDGSVLPVGCIGGTTTYTDAGGWDNGEPSSDPLNPNSFTDMVIDGNVTITGASGGGGMFVDNIAGCTLTVTTNGTLTINAGQWAYIEGNITVEAGGQLIIEHEASLVQADDDALVTNNGNISVRVTTPDLASRDFMVMGSPMDGESRTDVWGTTFLVLDHHTGNFVPNPEVAAAFPGAENFADDNYDNWQAYSGPINIGEGYIVRPQAGYGQPGGVFNFDYNTGTLNNGMVPFPVLFNTEKNDSPNVLANPYPSPISADDFINANAMVDEVYFWEHLTPPSPDLPGAGAMNFSMEDISMYNLMGGTAAAADPTGSNTEPNGVISTSQGFGIKASAVGTAVFNNSMRLTSGNTTLRQPLEKERIWVKISSKDYDLQSTALIGFSRATSQGLDRGYDSKRLATVLSLFSHLGDGTHELGIQSLQRFDTSIKIPMGFSTLVDEETLYEISLNRVEGENLSQQEVWLYDWQTGEETKLSSGGTYTFKRGKATDQNRFTLYFEKGTLGVMGLEGTAVAIYPNPADRVINIRASKEISNLIIYDMQGRKVFDKTLYGVRENTVDLFGIKSGIYLIEIETPNGRTIKRFVKK